LGHVRSQSKHSFVSITEKKCRAANATLNEFYDVLDDILSQNQTSNSTLRRENINRVWFNNIWQVQTSYLDSGRAGKATRISWYRDSCNRPGNLWLQLVLQSCFLFLNDRKVLIVWISLYKLAGQTAYRTIGRSYSAFKIFEKLLLRLDMVTLHLLQRQVKLFVNDFKIEPNQNCRFGIVLRILKPITEHLKILWFLLECINNLLLKILTSGAI